jgi:glycosyltransferase involved in cell wall biosynthesis
VEAAPGDQGICFIFMTDFSNDIDRIPASPPIVEKVTGYGLPKWSVMIPVYNCSQWLPEAIQSVVSQCKHRSDIQIEVIDDASTDADVAEIVNGFGEGRVGYFRQPFNMGSLRNFHTCLQRSKGSLIHLLHADDRVRVGFYDAFDALFDNHSSLGAAFCRFAYIDDRGKLMYNHQLEQESAGPIPNFVERLAERQRIQYVAMVVKRQVYESLGGFFGVEYGEDWEMWMRIAAQYPIGYIPQVLADYRRHHQSITGRSFVTGKNVRDLTFVMDRIRQYVPEGSRDRITRESKRFYAHYAIRTAKEIWKKFRNGTAARAQVREALKMRIDPSLLFEIAKLYVRMGLNL